MALNTTANIPPAVREYYDRLLLMTAYPQLVYSRFAQKRSMPRKSGDQIVFRRYDKLGTVPVPLNDGITPPGASLAVTDLKTQLNQYGNFVMYTDQVEYTVEDRVVNESSRLLAQNLGQTLDEITRDVLVSTLTVVQASQGNNGNTPTEMTQADIDTVTKTLLGNDALLISEVITGRDMFGTSPIRPSFFGFIDTDLLDDLEAVSKFQPTSSYPDQGPVLDGEWGATSNVRWLYSSIGYVTSASPAVYHCPVVGKEGYGALHLGSDAGEFFVEPLGTAGSSDPLHQRGSVGWKIWYAARILNDAFVADFQVTHS